MKVEFYHNFEITLKKLHQFSNQEIKDDLDKAGLIQGFEFTFEQCWKAIQKKGREDGLQINSPKQAFSEALSWGWIPRDKEQDWLEMIKDRNLTSHTYREELALEIISKIKNNYLSAFTYLLDQMKS